MSQQISVLINVTAINDLINVTANKCSHKCQRK